MQATNTESAFNGRFPSPLRPARSPRTQRWVGPANGRPIKVFFYSHDTFGPGGSRRNLAILDRLLAVPGQFSVHVLTESPPVDSPLFDRVAHLDALRVHELPAIAPDRDAEPCVRHDDNQRCPGLVKGYREALILKNILRHRPDIFLVDQHPAGVDGELLGALALIRREMPRMRVMLSLPDILDRPRFVRSMWREQGAQLILDQAYDDILVYGSRAHFDVVEGYGMTGRSAANVRYCGHVVAEPDSRPTTQSRVPAFQPPPGWNLTRAVGREIILLAAGQGGQGYDLMRAYLHALSIMPPGERYSVLVADSAMAEAEWRELRAVAAGRRDVEFIEPSTNLAPSILAADLIVTTAGYDISAEIVAGRKKSILAMSALPGDEKSIRAHHFARLGLARSVEAGSGMVAALANLTPETLAAPTLPESDWSALDRNGACRVAKYLLSIMDMRTQRACWEPTRRLA